MPSHSSVKFGHEHQVTARAITNSVPYFSPELELPYSHVPDTSLTPERVFVPP